jgi:hypothetical protein
MTVMLQLVEVTPLQALKVPLVMTGTAPETIPAPMGVAGAGVEPEGEDGVGEEQE